MHDEGCLSGQMNSLHFSKQMWQIAMICTILIWRQVPVTNSPEGNCLWPFSSLLNACIGACFDHGWMNIIIVMIQRHINDFQAAGSMSWGVCKQNSVCLKECKLYLHTHIVAHVDWHSYRDFERWIAVGFNISGYDQIAIILIAGDQCQ